MRLGIYIGFAGMLWSVFAATAVPRPQPYQVIPERNVFGLKEGRPLITEPTVPPPPSIPRITLTGITTILGNKRALFKAQPPATNGPSSTNELSMILTEGQREGFLEVLEIDEHEGLVRVNNSGHITTLSLEKDGPKPPPSSAVAQVTTNRAIPMVPTRGSYTIPGRPSMVPPNAVGALTPTGSNLSRVLVTDERNNGSRTYALDTPMPTNAAAGAGQTVIVPVPVLPPRETRLSAEEQLIYDEVQRELARQAAGQAAGGISPGVTPEPAPTAPLPRTSGMAGGSPSLVMPPTGPERSAVNPGSPGTVPPGGVMPPTGAGSTPAAGGGTPGPGSVPGF